MGPPKKKKNSRGEKKLHGGTAAIVKKNPTSLRHPRGKKGGQPSTIIKWRLRVRKRATQKNDLIHEEKNKIKPVEGVSKGQAFGKINEALLTEKGKVNTLARPRRRVTKLPRGRRGRR